MLTLSPHACLAPLWVQWSNFFRTLGIGIVAGRGFAASDVAGSPGLIVVTEDFARRAWPGLSPLGKHVNPRSRAPLVAR